MSPPQDPDSCHLKGAASPVPAAEHQALPSSLEVASAVFAGHADTASHQRYHGAEPAVRYVEPHREAFIALYEAASALLGALDIDCDTRALASIDNPCRALQGALDKAAPAYGQALVARAEALPTLAKGGTMQGRPMLSTCAVGDHSFSWREGIEPCRYCGEPVVGVPRIVAPWGITPEREAEMLAREDAMLAQKAKETGGQ